MSSGTKNLKHMTRKCNSCFIPGDKKQLRACTGCRSQWYCSVECQRADWKAHKSICRNNGLLEYRLKEHESTPMGMFDRLLLVDGISMYELDQRLEKWVRFHNSTLMAATIQALRLPEDVSRARTLLLHVRLSPRPQAEHGGSSGKFFRIEDATVIEVEDARRRESPWPESLEQLSGMADDMERMGRGTVAAAMIDCPPLAVQTVPFGSMTQKALGKEKVFGEWKAFLMRQVEEGQKPRLVRSGR